MAMALRASYVMRSLVSTLRISQVRYNSSLDRVFSSYETKCQRSESVNEKDFVKTFNYLTKSVANFNDNPNISLYSSILLRCCGNLMVDTPPKGRELLAGNLWTFIKDKKIPLDISHYNSLLKILNENETNFDPKKILDEINDAKLTPDRVTYQRLIHQYCLQGDVNGATSLLEQMKNLGFELNETIFASLIIGYGKQESPPPVTDIFDLMKSNNIEPGSKTYTAAFVSIAHRLDKDDKAIEEFKKVYELLSKDEVQLSTNEVVEIITNLSKHRAKHEDIANFLQDITSTSFGPVSSRYRILSAYIRSGDYNEAAKAFWSQKVSEKALQTGSIGVYWIKALARHHNVPVDFCLEQCDKLKERGYNLKAHHLLYYNAAEEGRLDLVRGALKKISDEEPIKIHYLWPLIAQAKDEANLVQVLKNDLNPLMDTNDLMETFSVWVWPKFSENISRLFELNKELNYDPNVLMASFLNYSVQEDKIMDAIKFISEAPPELVGNSDISKQENLEDDIEPVITPRLQRTNDRGSLVARLLHSIAEQTKDAELVKKAFSMCQLPNQQPSPRSVASLVRVHLLNNDFDSALEEFVRVYREYRSAPCRSELMQHCLNKKNPENLQKIMDCVTELYGESNALFDLAVSCLRIGKLKQAKKIFASPGFRVNPIRVYSTSRNLARQGQVDVLENFVSLARDMYDINQESLYQVLLDTYERTSNAKRALHLWNMMQEEEFQPSKRSLIMIADILEKNNIEVPFQRPRLLQQDRNKGTRT